MQNLIPHPTSSPDGNLSKNTMRYVENINKKSSFFQWQICQFNHYGWLILLKFYWFLNSNSQKIILARFLIRPILDPKFPLMGQEAVMPMEYILPSLRIAQIIGMDDTDTVHERLSDLLALEEDRIISGFHQKVQKAWEKAWHDRHIKSNTLHIGDLVLLYDSKFIMFPWKFKTHWLGPY